MPSVSESPGVPLADVLRYLEGIGYGELYLEAGGSGTPDRGAPDRGSPDRGVSDPAVPDRGELDRNWRTVRSRASAEQGLAIKPSAW